MVLTDYCVYIDIQIHEPTTAYIMIFTFEGLSFLSCAIYPHQIIVLLSISRHIMCISKHDLRSILRPYYQQLTYVILSSDSEIYSSWFGRVLYMIMITHVIITSRLPSWTQHAMPRPTHSLGQRASNPRCKVYIYTYIYVYVYYILFIIISIVVVLSNRY